MKSFREIIMDENYCKIIKNRMDNNNNK